ncbi:hypothetical protein TrST_g14230 [Triparma strigata]|uniref:Uncharacterized protein n=1 Tax=Triparma strigata TaxID=1606541 RepID=A0A9W7AVL9_9STRA|nr:hypothetical protein TrST_g14230 [Triparma strigata]
MKLSLAAALLLPLTTTGFILPPPLPSSTRLNLIAPSGTDALSKIVSESPSLPSPPSVLKTLKKVTFPASLIAGYVLTPSNRVLASALGSAVTGTFGLVGSSKMDATIFHTSKVSLAKLLLSKDIRDVSEEEVEDVRRRYGVDEEEWRNFKADVLRDYVRAECKSSMLKTTDSSIVTDLISCLSLPPVSVGLSIYDAANGVYADHCAWTSSEDLEDPEGLEYACVGKFCYLCERIFKDEGEEERKYEVDRISKVFSMNEKQWDERVSGVAVPFYERALGSARRKEEVGADMLRRAREQIGIRETEGARMHEVTYEEAVEEVLTETVGVLEVGRLTRLRSVLGISEAGAARLEAEKTRPLFEAKVEGVLEDLKEGDKALSSLVGKLAIASEDLKISPVVFDSVLSTQIKSTFSAQFTQVAQFVRVGNVSGVKSGVDSMISYLNSVTSFLQKIDNGMEGDETVAERILGFEVGMGMAKEKSNAYRMYLKASLSENESRLTEEVKATLERFSDLTKLSKFDATVVYKEVVGPFLKETVLSSTEDIHSLTGGAEIDEVVQNLGLNSDAVKEIKEEVYVQRLEEIVSSAEGGIFSEEQSAGLKNLMEFLTIEEGTAAKLHTRLNGPAFKNSVEEAMGDSGIIPEDYRAMIDQLRSRLMIPEDSGSQIFNSAIAERLDPMCKSTVDALNAIQSPPKEEDKDGLTMSAEQKTTDFMNKCIALVDFSVKNGVAEEIADGVESVEREVQKEVDKEVEREETKFVDKLNPDKPGEYMKVEEKVMVKATEKETVTETVTEEVPKFRYEFPLNAQAIGGMSDEAAEGVYKQYVIGGFSAKGDEEEKYSSYQKQVAEVLGLEQKQQTQIAGAIGAMVFDNYFSNQMAGKSELDQQDMMFLAQIKDKLNMSEEIVERLLLSTQKNMLSKQVERVFVAGTKITAESVKAVRDQAMGMGIDLARDLGVTDDRLGRMFTIEVSQGIEEGVIAAGEEGSNELAEIIESLGLAEAKAEELLEKLVKDRSSRIIKNISADVARGNDKRAMDDLPTFIAYAKFVGGEDMNLNIAQNVVDMILAVFESATFGRPGAEEDLGILRKSLN